jgi:hypothetical protein
MPKQQFERHATTCAGPPCLHNSHLLYAVRLLEFEPLVSTLVMAATARCVVMCYACFAECAVFGFASCSESYFLVLIHSRLPLTWGRGVGRRLGSYDVLPRFGCMSLNLDTAPQQILNFNIINSPYHYLKLSSHKKNMEKGRLETGLVICLSSLAL